MLCHLDRRMTKPVARRPLRPTGYDGMGPAAALPRDGERLRVDVSSWRLASSPMALVTRPYRLPPRAAIGSLIENFDPLPTWLSANSSPP